MARGRRVAEVADALEGLGWAFFLSGEDEKACASFEESLRLQRETGDPHLVNRAKVALGQVLVALERIEQARAIAAEILAFSRQHGNIRTEHSGWHYTADCELMEGNYAESLRLYRTSLALAQEIGDRLEIGFEVQGVGMSLSGLGQSERALRLGGAVEAEYERIGSTMHVRFWNALLAETLRRGQARAGRTSGGAGMDSRTGHDLRRRHRRRAARLKRLRAEYKGGKDDDGSTADELSQPPPLSARGRSRRHGGCPWRGSDRRGRTTVARDPPLRERRPRAGRVTRRSAR